MIRTFADCGTERLANRERVRWGAAWDGLALRKLRMLDGPQNDSTTYGCLATDSSAKWHVEQDSGKFGSPFCCGRT